MSSAGNTQTSYNEDDRDSACGGASQSCFDPRFSYAVQSGIVPLRSCVASPSGCLPALSEASLPNVHLYRESTQYLRVNF
jgi:hypothetical protein